MENVPIVDQSTLMAVDLAAQRAQKKQLKHYYLDL
jgi:hypothetical protein